jgi:hypothetical protein
MADGGRVKSFTAKDAKDAKVGNIYKEQPWFLLLNPGVLGGKA